MEFIKNVLGKIGTGAAYGIGFGVIMLALMWGSSLYYETKAENAVYSEVDGDCHSFKKCEETSGLTPSISGKSTY